MTEEFDAEEYKARAKQKLAELEQTLNTTLANGTTKINDAIATAVAEVEAQKVRSESDAAAAAASATKAEEAKVKATQAATESVATKNSADANLASTKTAKDEALAQAEAAKQFAAALKSKAANAAEADETIKQYKTNLGMVADEFDELSEKVESLLPGATSVGLAKSFNERKEALERQQKWYLFLFLSTIFLFILFGIWALLDEGIVGFQSFALFVLERTPIVIGLLLLEEFSRRQYRAASRMAEDYAYKATVSIAFDGYKKALGEIPDGEAELVHALSTNTLSTLNERPGRLVEEHQGTDTQSAELLADTASKAMNPNNNPMQWLQIISGAKGLVRSRLLQTAVIVVAALLMGALLGQYFFNGQTTSNDSPTTATGSMPPGDSP